MTSPSQYNTPTRPPQSPSFTLIQHLVVFIQLFSPFLCTILCLVAVLHLINALFHTATAASTDPSHVLIISIWAAYLGWMVVDYQTPFVGGTERFRFFRSWSGWSTYWQRYFPITMVRTAPLPTTRNYIIGLHPHGLYCLAAYNNFTIDHNVNQGGDHASSACSTQGYAALFPGLATRTATLNINFNVPIWRELNLWWKFISADYASCKHWLQAKPSAHVLLICIGGAQESLLSRPGSIDLIVHRRKGFVKLALDTGACIVPTISFGETDLYRQYVPDPKSPLRWFQDALKVYFGFTIPFLHGKFGMWLPLQRPVTTVVGQPIDVPHTPSPSRELVDQYHAIYLRHLKSLFEEHKDTYAAHGTQLEFIG